MPHRQPPFALRILAALSTAAVTIALALALGLLFGVGAQPLVLGIICTIAIPSLAAEALASRSAFDWIGPILAALLAAGYWAEVAGGDHDTIVHWIRWVGLPWLIYVGVIQPQLAARRLVRTERHAVHEIGRIAEAARTACTVR